jgi:hypothetical protein
VRYSAGMIALAESSLRLEDSQHETVERLIGGLDSWFGRFVGSYVARDVSALLDDNEMQPGGLPASTARPDLRRPFRRRCRR